MSDASESKPMDIEEKRHCSAQASSPRRRFISGVVEGFYGEPWSMDQRQRLFERLGRWDMKSYMYAPKDDAKHRQRWREPLSPAELDNISTLIMACREQGVDFIFAISPGLDMIYSSEAELNILKDKLDQVSRLGCSSFAVLFDDIELRMCAEDYMRFTSFAHAHVYVANKIYEHLQRPETFLFCPTEYCGSRAVPSVLESEYLNTVGKWLNVNIGVLWTGPLVIPRYISVESIQEVGKVLRRRPVIWDNLHANDYDRQRLFLGPYQGRPLTLRRYIRGVLTNPNCECEVNYIPMHTLSTWCSTPVPPAEPHPEVRSCGSSSDLSDSCSSTTSVLSDIRVSDEEFYSPAEALRLALSEWSQEVVQPRREKINEKSCNFGSPPGSIQPGPCASPCSVDEAFNFAPPSYSSPAITPEQVALLVDVFHLPHSHGQTATDLLKQLTWLWKSGGWCSVESATSTVVPNASPPTQLPSPPTVAAGEEESMTGGASSQSLESQGNSNSIPVVPVTNWSWPAESQSSADLAADHSDVDMQSEFSKEASPASTAAGLQAYNDYWCEQAVQFHSTCSSIMAMTTSVLDIPNFPLLNNIFSCILELQAAITKVESFVTRLENLSSEEQSRLLVWWSHPGLIASQSQTSVPLDGQWHDNSEPWSIRGGFAGDLLRQLPDLSFLDVPTTCSKSAEEVDSGISDAPPSPVPCDFLSSCSTPAAETLETSNLDFMELLPSTYAMSAG